MSKSASQVALDAARAEVKRLREVAVADEAAARNARAVLRQAAASGRVHRKVMREAKRKLNLDAQVARAAERVAQASARRDALVLKMNTVKAVQKRNRKAGPVSVATPEQIAAMNAQNQAAA